MNLELKSWLMEGVKDSNSLARLPKRKLTLNILKTDLATFPSMHSGSGSRPSLLPCLFQGGCRIASVDFYVPTSFQLVFHYAIKEGY